MSHFGGDKAPELTPCQEDAVFETDANSTHNAECGGFQSLTSQGCSQVPWMASTPESEEDGGPFSRSVVELRGQFRA